MLLLLGLCEEMNDRLIAAVKDVLERIWNVRSRVHVGIVFCT